MRGLVVAALVFALLLPAAAAHSQPQSEADYPGTVLLGIKGQGSVKLGKGFVHPQTIRCFPRACPRTVRKNVYATTGPHASLIATPYKGWRFAGWSGFCKSRKRTCAVNLLHVRPNKFGLRIAVVTARFTR